MPTRSWFALLISVWVGVTAPAMSTGVADADVITFGGTITQAQDPGSPAVNNPLLNDIQFGDSYLVTLEFGGSITGPGLYNLPGASLTFADAAAGAVENSFDAITLIITANGLVDDVSLLGCLTTGSGCSFGNQLSANFQIPAASLNSQNVTAVGLDQPHPLDLLEDDGVTDIHGSVTTYSYASAVPEPSSALLWCCAVAAMAVRRLRRTRSSGGEHNIMIKMLAVVALLLVPSSALAVDGVVLVNQATVMASGGFPYTIVQPGSYRLSGNLVVPNNSHGILIATDNVTIDLNGFSIIGPHQCAASESCAPGVGGPIGHGIVAGTDAPSREYFNITIRNGTIQGMGQDAIHLLGDSIIVENVRARHNLLSGIVVRAAGFPITRQVNLIIYRTTVQRNGSYGIKAFGGLITENTIAESGDSGISVQTSNGGVVARDVVTGSSGYGLDLRPGVGYAGNTMTNNAAGHVLSGNNMGQNVCGTTPCP